MLPSQVRVCGPLWLFNGTISPPTLSTKENEVCVSTLATTGGFVPSIVLSVEKASIVGGCNGYFFITVKSDSIKSLPYI